MLDYLLALGLFVLRRYSSLLLLSLCSISFHAKFFNFYLFHPVFFVFVSFLIISSTFFNYIQQFFLSFQYQSFCFSWKNCFDKNLHKLWKIIWKIHGPFPIAFHFSKHFKHEFENYLKNSLIKNIFFLKNTRFFMNKLKKNQKLS